jgi:signal transduction histidine kinase
VRITDRMSATATRRLAISAGVLCVVCLVGSLLLLVLDWRAIDSASTAQLSGLLAVAIVTPLGVLIAARRPRNAVGWVLLAAVITGAVGVLAVFVAMYGQLRGASPTGWVEWPVWLNNETGQLDNYLVLIAILLFPNGHLPGRQWRWVLWPFVGLAMLGVVSTALQPGADQLSPRLPSIPYPIGIKALNPVSNGRLTPAVVAAAIVFVVFLVLIGSAVVIRLRRAQGVERRQLRWFTYVVVATVVVGVVGAVIATENVAVGNNIGSLQSYGFGIVLPATIGIAIIKDGLYDLDVFISRALVYGSLAVFITAVYVGIAVGIGTLVGSGGKPNLALSILATAIVAIGFQPVRERVQKVANRLVYGKRATPYEVLSEFAGRVAETYAADEVLPRMARVLQEGTGAESATVWLRGMAELRPAATFPELLATHGSVPMSNGTVTALPEATRSVEVRHQGELLGALSVTKRRGETLTPIEEKLVDDLAHQAGLVLKNVGLSADLQARVDELRASRQRLVGAQDLERRRLERNLHDGAQQHLVALKVKLGLAEILLGRDPLKAAATLKQLKGDADEALETLRDLARGIYPPLLADKGLVVALESQARKATLPVIVEAQGVQRYAQDVEATVYFCVLEALQNVQKYAGASHVVVRLRESDRALLFEVEDDGAGFDAKTVKTGAGLTNMNDRVDALGGSVEVVSHPGAGTCVRGALPAPAPAAEP